MSRLVFDLNKSWFFHLGDCEGAERVDFEDEEWRELNLPHDWSIEGRFIQFRDENWYMFKNLDHRIGYLPQGIGWYRKHLEIPVNCEGKRFILQFDGVYRDSDVWINGQHLGHRPYGYSTFFYDVTSFIEPNKDNIIAVRVDNLGVSSRWYAGSGIYRKVTLIVTEMIHIAPFGTYWKTPEVSKEKALVDLELLVENSFLTMNKDDNNKFEILILSEVFEKKDGALHKLPDVHHTLSVKLTQETNKIQQKLEILNPKLWSPDSPHLYEIKTMIYSRDGILIDEYITPLGLRSFNFNPDKGFFLNGENIKFKGVCLHHDNGCLGSKVFADAIERKLNILKEMGCNAIRTSHNPPSQEMLELCDKMGFMVMDEAFDEWTMQKTPYGYWRHFDKWYERDVRDFIRRDRNHPCVIIWSCGNEVSEQRVEKGTEILEKLLKVFHDEDPTRPVTQGCNQMEHANRTGFADMLDIVGYNYYGDRITGSSYDGFRCMYDDEHEEYPKRIMIGSENCSAFNTRGIYHYPIVYARWSKVNDDMHCSSYDITSEIPLMILDSREYVCGMFTWEGFDYLGEPTPYPWPARSSHFGIVDLCGFPKNLYYLYQSQWTDRPMVHLFPHWNWSKGDVIPVWVYSNCECVELFLNGESLGEKSFLDEDYNDVLHLMWDVEFEPGELKAVVRNKGKFEASKSVFTAGHPKRLVLSSNKKSLKFEGELAFLEVETRDTSEKFVPIASNLVTFKVKGPGKIIGVGNGNPISHEPFIDEQRHLFNGLCLAVLQKKEGDDDIIVKASSGSLQSAEIRIKNMEVIKSEE
ncbi:MAG: DUF4982 domain-containing protein [Candidatus Lokiarchaeota archaeon]|nr:DUF4982 domain-containing protein [Candidatus Lokiarchaeota archaeon]